MCEFIKVYGIIISPLVAIILGIIAVFIKTWIDNVNSIKQTIKSYNNVKSMLNNIKLPKYSSSPRSSISDEIFIDAFTARNLTNISRMYFSIIAAYNYLLSLNNDINKSGNLLIINQYYYLSWRLKKLIDSLEAIRNNKRINVETWNELNKEIPGILNFLEEDWFKLNT